ncbi:MAG: DUF1080 domain-containing protein [Paludisphaera borealis]|uniref:3-keto-disaccharide hydrolase n=1 Tax=Paludisphaera borealis TaxID=1387353 RepID=UPI0028470925|nr:DUF1080 domain-containing protein [Paludisphaera borealis]MDR3622905.1 DUF1080 domain-containing protein [Paludisphaera borealis]
MFDSRARKRLAIVACLATLVMSGAQNAKNVPSALESDGGGWSDLLGATSAGLDAWTREPIPAGGELPEDSPWKLDSASGVLSCAPAGGGREWLRLDQVLLDFILHVEWRFQPEPGATNDRAGIFVRNSNDARMWHKAECGDAKGGYLVGETFAASAIKPFNLEKEVAANRVKPAGEWNTYELTCKGRLVTLWVNGVVANQWKGCGVPRGYLGLEAERGRIEFRNIKLKAL